MNCQPGDLAIVIRTSRCGRLMAGKMVEVLYVAPGHEFDLPDGYIHLPCQPGDWVVKSLGSPFEAPLPHTSETRVTMYGVIADFALRPLRWGVETEKVDEVTA